MNERTNYEYLYWMKHFNFRLAVINVYPVFLSSELLLSAHRNVNWTNVTLKNETRFRLVSDRPVIMRRRPGEECLLEMPLHHYEAWRGWIVVWGRFSRNGVWRLLRINRNAQHCLKILKYCTVHQCNISLGISLPYSNRIMLPAYSKELLRVDTGKWYQNSVMAGRQQSSLDPVENVWGQLARKLTKKNFRNGKKAAGQIKGGTGEDSTTLSN